MIPLSVGERPVATVVFGEALVDDFVTEQLVGGAPFNVARNLAAFMSPQLMITRIGDDRNGAVVRGEFERFAMSESGLQLDRMEETGRVLVERRPGGHRFVILPKQAYDFIDPTHAIDALAGVTPAAIYFGTLAQRCPRSHDTLYKAAGGDRRHALPRPQPARRPDRPRLRVRVAACGRHRQGQRGRAAGAVQLVLPDRPRDRRSRAKKCAPPAARCSTCSRSRR